MRTPNLNQSGYGVCSSLLLLPLLPLLMLLVVADAAMLMQQQLVHPARRVRIDGRIHCCCCFFC